MYQKSKKSPSCLPTYSVRKLTRSASGVSPSILKMNTHGCWNNENKTQNNELNEMKRKKTRNTKNIKHKTQKTLTLPKLNIWAAMASGMAGKRIESLVPRTTSCRLVSSCLSKANLTLDTRVRSDFFLSEEEDTLCAVLPGLISLLDPFRFPFSKFPYSFKEAMEWVAVTTRMKIGRITTQKNRLQGWVSCELSSLLRTAIEAVLYKWQVYLK